MSYRYKGKISDKTIYTAEKYGYAKDALKKARATKDSLEFGDVELHRGIQTFVRNNGGVVNRAYKQANNDIIHYFDSGGSIALFPAFQQQVAFNRGFGPYVYVVNPSSAFFG